MAYELRSARYLAADVMRAVLTEGDRAVDATMGNGHDTCMLAELVGKSGHVDAFDVQEGACKATAEALTEAGLLDRCSLHLTGHEHMAEHVTEPVKAVMFNLGWLPGGDKHITTLWHTTEAAIQTGLALLLPGGVMTICVYPGHPEGERELTHVEEMLSRLKPQAYNVLHQRFLNAGQGAPSCFVIQKQHTYSKGADAD